MTSGSDVRKPLKFSTSPGFNHWLWERKASLAFTTYEVGKVFLVGLKHDQSLSFFERTFDRCMSLCVDGNALWMSTRFQLWRFQDALKGQRHREFDRVYLPQVAYITGDLDIHDLGLDPDGHPIFVNTLFSCLASTSDTHSFEVTWRPSWISKLAAEDRCHLNGVAMQQGQPRFVTAVSASDGPSSWRERRHHGGVVVDCQANTLVLDSLSMPHSPRLYRDELWLLNSGAGYFGRVDVAAGKFEPLTFCPGFLRGLTFLDEYAIVTTSLPRSNRTFDDLELRDELRRRDKEARCQLCVIDLRTMELTHWLRLEGLISELYDVAGVTGTRRPMMIGLQNEEVHRTLSIEEGR